MKYTDFYKYLTIKTNGEANIGSSISIKLGNSVDLDKISVSQEIENKKSDRDKPLRFIIFPVKIYGETIRHLNILILDRKTKIIERYEPFDQYLNFHRINDLIESLLYKWMEQRKIYFLKYQTTLNSKPVLCNKNCGIYCINFIMKKLKVQKSINL